MRTVIVSLLLLSGCAAPLPAVDPQQAWVDLRPEPGQVLMADELDRRDLRDGRYFQMPPGAHELRVRLQFERPGGGFGEQGDGPRWLTCHLQFSYAEFAAGQRYRIEARPVPGLQARGWLRDQQGRVLARARVLRCADF